MYYPYLLSYGRIRLCTERAKIHIFVPIRNHRIEVWAFWSSCVNRVDTFCTQYYTVMCVLASNECEFIDQVFNKSGASIFPKYSYFNASEKNSLPFQWRLLRSSASSELKRKNCKLDNGFRFWIHLFDSKRTSKIKIIRNWNAKRYIVK
jgi:hypothetical protein